MGCAIASLDMYEILLVIDCVETRPDIKKQVTNPVASKLEGFNSLSFNIYY